MPTSSARSSPAGASSAATRFSVSAAGKVATGQSYIGELVDGTRNDMHNCNFFDIDADGRFTRVIIWMAGTNPLK